MGYSFGIYINSRLGLRQFLFQINARCRLRIGCNLLGGACGYNISTVFATLALGPERKEAQVEISLTDGRSLGILPPVRLSGDVANSPGAVLAGPEGRVTLEKGVIAAQRHIHMKPETAEEMGVRDGQRVKLQAYTSRPVVFEDVAVRVSPEFASYVHLDYDEANSCGFRKGDLGRILP